MAIEATLAPAITVENSMPVSATTTTTSETHLTTHHGRACLALGGLSQLT